MTRNAPPEDRNLQSDREKARLDRMLDIGLNLTFPGSDPVAITIAKNKKSDGQDGGDTATD